MGNEGINTAAWKRLRAQVIARDGGQCVKCGSTEQLEADHIQPRATGGQHTPDNLRTLCRRCNRARKTPRPRARTAQGTPQGPEEPFSAQSLDPAPNRGAIPPGSRRVARPRTRNGLILPRLESPKRRAAGDYGDEVAQVAQEHMGITLTPWQRYAAGRATQFDADGDWLWSTVVLTIARGQGKSWWLQAMGLWRLLRADLFGEPQEVVSVAQKLEIARMGWNRVATRLEETGQTTSVRRAAGQECINVRDGSTWRVLAASMSSVTGYRASLVIVDEAWNVSREVVEAGLIPQQVRRKQPQLYLCSTAGDGSSDLLTTFRDRAMRPKSSTLLLEWSAPPGADPEHPDSWRWANPDGEFTGKARRRWLDLWEITEESKFRTQYLNAWVVARSPWIPPTVWRDSVSAQEPTETGVVAVDTSVDGESFSAVWVSVVEDGYVVRSIRDDKPRRVWEWVADLPDTTRIYVGVGIDGLQPMGMRVTGRWGGRELRRYIPGVRKAVLDGRVMHGGNELLAEHVLRAQLAQTQSGMAFKMAHAPIDLAREFVVAAGIAQRYRAPILVT